MLARTAQAIYHHHIVMVATGAYHLDTDENRIRIRSFNRICADMKKQLGCAP
jgi:hypothetical protein